MDHSSKSQSDQLTWFADLPEYPMTCLPIFSKLVVIGIVLVAFSVESIFNAPAFVAGDNLPNATLVGINTIVFITGGWALACGLLAARFSCIKVFRLWFSLAIDLDIIFVTIKLVEYDEEIGVGAVFDEDGCQPLPNAHRNLPVVSDSRHRHLVGADVRSMSHRRQGRGVALYTGDLSLIPMLSACLSK